MPPPDPLFRIYLAVALGVGVILVAMAVAMFIYQRQYISLHRGYSKKLLAAQEEERAWVAREVHDDALQRVALLQHELSDWGSGDHQAVGVATRENAKVVALRQELADLGVMLRRVAHRLHPTLIDQAGLLPALQQLALDVGRAAGMEIETDFRDEGSAARLSRERALILYRIAQEGLRNAAKHSGARRARLAVRSSELEIEISIQDFGKGFDPSASRQASGLGLISMAERARLVDGRFELWSREGEGTTIRVSVPLRG